MAPYATGGEHVNEQMDDGPERITSGLWRELRTVGRGQERVGSREPVPHESEHRTHGLITAKSPFFGALISCSCATELILSMQQPIPDGCWRDNSVRAA